MIELYVAVEHETDAAILIDECDTWLPKSQIECDLEVGECGDILVPEWLAKVKGLI